MEPFSPYSERGPNFEGQDNIKILIKNLDYKYLLNNFKNIPKY